MKTHWATLVGFLIGVSSLISCHEQSRTQDNFMFVEAGRKDTTDVIQTVLHHKMLDSLLNFAFDGQTLKIVKNKFISQPLNLSMNGKPVMFTSIDSTSDQLRTGGSPKFFAKITVFKQTNSNTRVVIFFEGIGLFAEYWLSKNGEKKWIIDKFNFVRA